MSYELPRVTGVIDPTVIDSEVFALTQQGIRVADAIAVEETFNHDLAELSMRNLAGLFNGFDSVDDATIASLGSEDVNRLKSLAIASYDFLGDTAKDDAKKNIDDYHPRSDDEATTIMLRHSFNALHRATSIGPNREGGYVAEKEVTLRQLTRQYAQTFASTYCALSALNHRIADPRHRGYFMSNITAATPRALRDEGVPTIEQGSNKLN